MNANTFKTVLLMTLLMGLFIFIGGLIGGSKGAMIAFIFAFVMNFGSYWFSDKIVLSLYKAQEVTEAEAPVLYGIVRRLATKGNLPMPKVYIIPSGAPNAFATGRNPQHAAVAVTRSLMDMLTTEELEGVIAHELAHVHGRDILIGTIAATIAGAVMMIADIFKWGMIFGGGNSDEENSSPLGMVAGIAIAIIAPIAATLVQMSISRSREYLADERGASLCGNPLALASALGKISYIAQAAPMEEAKPATAHMFIVN
ncbi:MAG: zinc metalloprotease HtpX, partial [Deferribacterales bacterium]|nr:zinc metalloprotease HtpX [Deferribacterales bacterium]